MTRVPDAAALPVTVIGGYLGAGKTTLLNHLLGTTDERLAVLVNDFGAINIDADLIESTDGDMMTLANGCICCSLTDGLVAALNEVMAADPRPERLVIEASGVADPATVAAYAHAPGRVLDGVIVVADAETVLAKSTDRYVGDTILAQLRSADLVLLNKIDLVPEEMLAETRSWLAEVATGATVIDTAHAEISPSVVLGQLSQEGRFAAPESAPSHDHDHGPAHDHATDAGAPSFEAPLFDTISFDAPGPIDRDRLERLLATAPEGTARVKGIVTLADSPDRATVVQLVGRRWSLADGGVASPDQRCRLVAIGRPGSLPPNWFRSGLTDR